ncbi:hypothetical protein JHK82_032516 [Glycine max]|uniref:Enoyl reductase (ER) domain-containing protein n=2 Tax=Glycine subgen. Soja TaxID=1462606 RepID=I1LP48_SOYBN|nr:alcohol dehydrogenase-like 2 [Glycine soja]KAG4979267.1 hypothetical protein JHK85_033225 [Glycine max]KAG4966801.1 hypothetical protein JHK87_032452 [Glycine soja]KAG5118096.1 hypothetical protein JHK82_032516 [Glycine max]KAH1141101.1 hypothetical protein GYH30_032390 [Glycine max]KAH1219807.1 Alcohol dehydrogenase-like 2 [Glycine max]
MPNTSQVISCKAAICWGAGKPVTVEEIQVDPPKATEVRVKMLCASLCHTDISSIQGFPYINFPLALGHEGVGVVESVGDQVRNLKEGDVVIPTYIGECQECENCVSGKTNLCLTYPIRLTGLLPDNTSRMSIRGQRLHHVLSCATWSEYMVSDANYTLKVDPTIDPAHASFISCGFSTGYGAAWKEAKVESGSSVAVFGLGAVGLGAISGAKMLGATKIIGIDKNEMKREKGEAFGMTDFIKAGDSAKSVSELVKEMSGGMGVDYSFECSGVAPLLTESVEATKVGTGKTIAIGTGTEPIIPFGLTSIMYGRTLKGSVFGGLKAISDLSIVANKCQKEEFPLQELFTHEVPLTDINKAFELLKKPNCVKVVIKMSH